MALTAKQKRFVDEYLIDLNATQAAIRAGYKEKTARITGSENLAKPNIFNEIQSRIKDREQRTEISQDMVLKELAAIAFADGSQYASVVEKQSVITTDDGTRVPLYDEKGNPIMCQDVELVLTDKLTPLQRKAISGIKQGKFGIEVATYDKVKALELLGKHLGMFKDKVELSGSITTETSKLDELIKQLNTDD